MARIGVQKLRRGDVDDAPRKRRRGEMADLSSVLRQMGAVAGRDSEAGAAANGVLRDSGGVLRVRESEEVPRVNAELVWRSFRCRRCACWMIAGFYHDQRYSVFRQCRRCGACWGLYRDGQMKRDLEGEEAARNRG